MAMEQYFQGSMTHEPIDEKHSFKNWNSLSDAMDEPDDTSTGGFDCNICLDTVQDPVVTLCGHLYCWPCIYKWIDCQSVSNEYQDRQPSQCPVCKAEVSEKTLVPLYGGSKTTSSSAKTPNLGINIPQRPSSPRCRVHNNLTTNNTTQHHPSQQSHYQSYHQLQQPHPYYPYSTPMPMFSLGETTTTSLFDHPMIGMFGEMVHSRMFGNSETTLYGYPNSYQQAGSSSPRARRHVMEADKSLGRICFFLLCCMVLCLLLF